MSDPVQAAIERGDATARVLISHRDAIIRHLAAVLLITGPEGLRACAAGAAEAVIVANRNLVGRSASTGASEAAA